MTVFNLQKSEEIKLFFFDVLVLKSPTGLGIQANEIRSRPSTEAASSLISGNSALIVTCVDSHICRVN